MDLIGFTEDKNFHSNHTQFENKLKYNYNRLPEVLNIHGMPLFGKKFLNAVLVVEHAI